MRSAQLAVDLARRASTSGGAERDLVVAAPLDAHAEAVEQPEHRLDVADPRHVADDDLLLGEERGGEDGQGAVLVAGGHDRAGQRDAASMTNFSMSVRGRPRRAQGPSRALG